MKSSLITLALITGLLTLSSLLQILLDFFFGKEALYLFFFPVIFIIAWKKGAKAGILTSAAASLLVFYFFFPRLDSFSAAHAHTIVEVYLFLLQGIALSVFINKAKQYDVVEYYKLREDAFSKKYSDLEKRFQDAQEDIRARDEFLSIASHELKTPLTSMLLQLQTALHNIQNVSLANFSVEHLLKMLESVQRQTNRLSKMINDLLNVSLMTTRKLELEPEKFDLSALTKEVVESFSEKIIREGYDISIHADTPVVGVWDKVRIEQALTNLLSNAIKYGDAKPIVITVKEINNFALVAVADHGIGIPGKEKDKIFELFQRGGASEKYKGLGVGLYITDQIVEAHKGKIHVKSREHHGTTFTMELPIK
jgi:signal transduction histidine kinase